MFTLFDASAPSWNLLVLVLLEVLVVTQLYGLDRFLDNLVEMDIKLGKITRCEKTIIHQECVTLFQDVLEVLLVCVHSTYPDHPNCCVLGQCR